MLQLLLVLAVIGIGSKIGYTVFKYYHQPVRVYTIKNMRDDAPTAICNFVREFDALGPLIRYEVMIVPPDLEVPDSQQIVEHHQCMEHMKAQLSTQDSRLDQQILILYTDPELDPLTKNRRLSALYQQHYHDVLLKNNYWLLCSFSDPSSFDST